MDSLYVSIVNSDTFGVVVNTMEIMVGLGIGLLVTAGVLFSGYCGWYLMDTIVKVNRRNS